jgi:hypothetical protein
LLKEVIDSDDSMFSDESDSSGTEDLTEGEVIGAKYSDGSDDVQFVTPFSAPSVSSASSAILKWEDMTNYVGQREHLLITMGLKMKPKMKLTVLICSKCL